MSTKVVPAHQNDFDVRPPPEEPFQVAGGGDSRRNRRRGSGCVSSMRNCPLDFSLAVTLTNHAMR